MAYDPTRSIKQNPIELLPCSTPIPMTDFTIGGSWGNHISWQDSQSSHNVTRKVYGHLSSLHPEIGQTLRGEFEKSIIIFEFTSITHPRFDDPPDMFFADVRIIERIPRDAYKHEVDHVKITFRKWWQLWKDKYDIVRVEGVKE